MERNTIIAIAAATTGIVAAATIAGVAVVQTTSTQTAAPPVVPLVGQPAIEPISAPQIQIPTASAMPTAAPSAVVGALPTPEATTLPPVPSATATQPAASTRSRQVTELRARNLVLAQTPGEVVSIQEAKVQGRTGWAVRVARPDGSIVTAYVDGASGVIVEWALNSPAATPTPSAAAKVSANEASAAVLRETSGSVVSIDQDTHQGRDAWAVRVSRPDGSVVTGYVDLASGVVFDWIVNQGPTNQVVANPAPAAKPTPTPTASYGDDHGDDQGDEGDDEGDDHGRDGDDD